MIHCLVKYRGKETGMDGYQEYGWVLIFLGLLLLLCRNTMLGIHF